MKFFKGVTLAAMATMVSAAAIKRSTPLEVTLSAEGHQVTAVVKNTGSTNLNLLSLGNLLDKKDPVERVQVSKGENRAPFTGMTILPAFNALVPSSFTLIKAGESLSITLDPSELHDLTEGGDFDVQASGTLYLADENSLTLNGQTITYNSNLLSIPISQAHARRTHSAALANAKRATINGNCQGAQLDAVTQALGECVNQSNKAADAARSGDAGKFNEYFKSTDQGARNTVADRFSAVAGACANIGSGSPTLSCVDEHPDQPCSNGAGAYAYAGTVVWCPYWFDTLPLVTGQCHAPDKANIVIHEFTHVPEVYAPGTADHAYYYEGVIALGPEQAITNADTFALYANAINVGNGC